MPLGIKLLLYYSDINAALRPGPSWMVRQCSCASLPPLFAFAEEKLFDSVEPPPTLART